MSTPTVSTPGTRVGSASARSSEPAAGVAGAPAATSSRRRTVFIRRDGLEGIVAAVQGVLEALRERAEAGERVAVLRRSERPLAVQQAPEARSARQPVVVVARLDAVAFVPKKPNWSANTSRNGVHWPPTGKQLFHFGDFENSVLKSLVRERVEPEEVDEMAQLVGDHEPANRAVQAASG